MQSREARSFQHQDSNSALTPKTNLPGPGPAVFKQGGPRNPQESHAS